MVDGRTLSLQRRHMKKIPYREAKSDEDVLKRVTATSARSLSHPLVCVLNAGSQHKDTGVRMFSG